MLPKLPETVDYGADVVSRATAAQMALIRNGTFRGDQMLADGLIAAGIHPDMAGDYGSAISTNPEVRDNLFQAPFATGFAIGSAVVAEARIKVEK